MAKKFPSKKGSGKKSGLKSKGAKKGSSRSSARSSGRASSRPPAVRTKSLLGAQVICRECHEEYALNLASPSDVVICPSCGHGATRPTDDLLHQITLYKGQEEGAFRMALIFFFVSIGSFLTWVFGTGMPGAEAESAGMFWAPIAVAFMSLVACAFFGLKYEKKRFETYF